jgi:hypothetical protein
MINWPEQFCTELVDRGLHVIRFDNRDTGRSSHLPMRRYPISKGYIDWQVRASRALGSPGFEFDAVAVAETFADHIAELVHLTEAALVSPSATSLATGRS